MEINCFSHPLFHTLDNEAQVFTHLLFAQVLLFTALQKGQGWKGDRESLESQQTL